MRGLTIASAVMAIYMFGNVVHALLVLHKSFGDVWQGIFAGGLVALCAVASHCFYVKEK